MLNICLPDRHYAMDQTFSEKNLIMQEDDHGTKNKKASYQFILHFFQFIDICSYVYEKRQDGHTSKYQQQL